MADIFEIVGKVSLDGLDKAEKDLRGFSDTGEQSASKLSKLGSIAGAVGKGVLIGTGAVATGAVALVKSVSGAYGQLQQSIGGIETLFGDSAQKVIENANNAYTTAGISANDYMQQVTSFSASLLQSLGGDTQKACDSADMAIRDMADNANKMGTSMEMIQNAYQGFSKQNYTMLDNLKLGYGGTKAEMERLLADAEKISGIKYDISNLNDVYSAIHVIQQELGITGTTALEAGETIEGSFNSLSASWENFIAGLGNPDADMKLLVDNLAKGISGAITNVIPVINNMVSVLPTVMDALIGAVNDMLPTLITTFTELITQVINAIVQLLPTLIPMVVETLKSVINTLVENLPLIIDAVILLVTEVIKALSEMLPQLIPTIIQAIVDIANSLLENLPIILDAVLKIVLGIADSLLVNGIPILINALPQLINGIINFLVGSIPVLIEASIQLFMALVNAIPLIIEALVNALPQIITAIVNGLITATPLLIEASIQLFMALVQAIPVIAVELVNAFPQIISAVMTGLGQLLLQIGEWTGTLLSKVVSFFGDLISTGATKTSEFVTKIVDFIKQLPEKIGYWLGFVIGTVAKFVIEFPAKAKEAGTNFINNLINFIKNLPSTVANWLTSTISKVSSFAINIGAKAKQAGTNIFNGIVNTIKNLPSTITSIGTDIVKGLWNGITGAGNWLKDKITGFANGIINGFKDAFGIKSPSRLMRDEVGTYLSQGLGVGIEEDDSAEKSMQNKIDSILGVANNSMANIKVGISVDDIVTESPMQKYQLDFNAQIGALNDGFDKLISLVGQYLPNIAGRMDRNIVLDGNSLAVGISRAIDVQLGKMSVSKGRGNI